MQLPLFQITPEEIFQAYYDCRKHKRNTREALEFEFDFEHNLLVLLNEINSFSYEVGKSSVFIIDKPVVREVFAASFRDRIVHHLLINLIGPTLERHFIFDSYACRTGKGSHLGIERLRKAVAANPNAWILKMDISSFFMSIDRNLLWKRIKNYLEENLNDPRMEIILHLTQTIIFNDPTVNCIFRSPFSKWDSLALEKSLFFAKQNCGLPIGNLTSQVFANFYMSDLDHYIKHDLGIKCYGRYVDDFYLIHEDKEYLKKCKKCIESFVGKHLRMGINHRKTYFQRCDKGVKFLGVKVEVGHINMSSRTIGNFRRCLAELNSTNANHRLKASEMGDLRSRVNSYLGIMGHYDTYRLRRRLVGSLDGRILKRISVESDMKWISLSL